MPLPPDFRRLAELKHFAASFRRHAGAGIADIDDQFISALGSALT